MFRLDPDDLPAMSELELVEETGPGEEHLSVFLTNESNYKGKALVTNRDMPGRLLNPDFESFYRDVVKAPNDMCEVYSTGYKIPFESDPPPQSLLTKNNASCLKQTKFCWLEMQRLLALGCVREVEEGDSEVILPLSAVYSNKMRLVVDASRHLNPYVKKVLTKLEDLKQFPYSSETGDFCAVDDLDSGYWHVPLSRESWKYCGCSLVNPEDGVRHFYEWTVLFLGLTSAVTIFTEILQPVTSYLRGLGWRGQLYIDDVILCARERNESHYWRFFATDVLGRCGWVINPSKGQEPTQCPKFLGFLCDTQERNFLIPQKKV